MRVRACVYVRGRVRECVAGAKETSALQASHCGLALRLRCFAAPPCAAGCGAFWPRHEALRLLDVLRAHEVAVGLVVVVTLANAWMRATGATSCPRGRPRAELLVRPRAVALIATRERAKPWAIRMFRFVSRRKPAARLEKPSKVEIRKQDKETRPNDLSWQSGSFRWLKATRVGMPNEFDHWCHMGRPLQTSKGSESFSRGVFSIQSVSFLQPLRIASEFPTRIR